MKRFVYQLWWYNCKYSVMLCNNIRITNLDTRTFVCICFFGCFICFLQYIYVVLLSSIARLSVFQWLCSFTYDLRALVANKLHCLFVGWGVFEAGEELQWARIFTRSDKRRTCQKQLRRGEIAGFACRVVRLMVTAVSAILIIQGSHSSLNVFKFYFPCLRPFIVLGNGISP